MLRKGYRKVLSFLTRSPKWVVLFGALLLLALFALFSYAALQQSERSMARLLGEKGDSLLSVCDSILRSGLRHEVGIRLQVLLEEMRSTSDIVFACVTTAEGTILAHSDVRRVGEILEMDGHEVEADDLSRLKPDWKSCYHMLDLEGKRVFAVYRYFAPGAQYRLTQYPRLIIFLGLDISPFEVMRRQNRVYISILSGLSLLMFSASVIALVFAERARTAARLQKQAEGQIRELEEEVKRREKLAAIGSLAAGVAHEIRNPLSSIKGFATYFGERFSPESDDRKCAEIMVQEVERLNRVINDLIGLSKQGSVQLQSIEARDLLEHVMRLLSQNAHKQRVEIVIHVAKNMPAFFADRERIHQALLNLCLNSLRAMPDGGRLTLGARRGKHSVSLFVLDTGEGIPQAILPQIFDPYFTTHGSGTGLGLALVHKIIEAHHGSIVVRSRSKSESKRPSGTLFRLILPMSL